MAHWTSPRLRDDESPPPFSPDREEYQDKADSRWRRRFWLVSSVAVAMFCLQFALLMFRNNDVNTVATVANKKLQILQAERDDLKKKLATALEQNRRLMSELDRVKNENSHFNDKLRAEQPTEKPTPRKSP